MLGLDFNSLRAQKQDAALRFFIRGMYVCIHKCKYVYVCLHIYIHTYTSLYIYIQTCIHTYIHNSFFCRISLIKPLGMMQSKCTHRRSYCARSRSSWMNSEQCASRMYISLYNEYWTSDEMPCSAVELWSPN